MGWNGMKKVGGSSGRQLNAAMNAVGDAAMADPVVGALLKKHEAKLSKVDATIGHIFGLCLAEMARAGFTPEEVGELAAATVKYISK